MDTRGDINYLRRTVGAILCLSPVLLLIASLAYGFMRGGETRPVGMFLVLLGATVGMVNFCLSYVRPFLYRLKQGSNAKYRHVSGFTGIGTLLVLAGGIIGFGSASTALLGLITVILDTGGLPHFLIATWRDSSLWDE